MQPSIFYRIAAVLLLLFAAGHTLGFRQSDPNRGVDAVVGSMRSAHVDVQGFNHTYRDLFAAAGFSVGVFYLFAAILAWQVGGLPAATFGAHMRQCVGVRPFLCRHRGCELEIPLYHNHRFLNPDYIVFDCGGVAFRETGFHASVATVRCEIPRAAVSVTRNSSIQSAVSGSLPSTESTEVLPRLATRLGAVAHEYHAID